jgi:hypothetical protein
LTFDIQNVDILMRQNHRQPHPNLRVLQRFPLIVDKPHSKDDGNVLSRTSNSMRPGLRFFGSRSARVAKKEHSANKEENEFVHVTRELLWSHEWQTRKG